MTLQSATCDRQDAREQALALTFGNLASGDGKPREAAQAQGTPYS